MSLSSINDSLDKDLNRLFVESAGNYAEQMTADIFNNAFTSTPSMSKKKPTLMDEWVKKLRKNEEKDCLKVMHKKAYGK